MLDHPGFRHADLSSVGSCCPAAPPCRPRWSAGSRPRSARRFDRLRPDRGVPGNHPDTPAGHAPRTGRTPSGRPLPQTEVKIVDPATGADRRARRGRGDLHPRLPRDARLLRDPGKTAAAIDADGWLHTGDLAAMDERGYCQIAGRLKDMIIRGGENIYPREIEDVLFDHPAVADVAVVGVPDAKWGEQVAAFIRPAPGQAPDPGRARQPTAASASRRTRPRATGLLEQFPLTPSGKIQKFVLQERFLARGPDVAIQAESTDIAAAAPPAS